MDIEAIYRTQYGVEDANDLISQINLKKKTLSETEKEIAELEEKMASGAVDDAIFSKHGELKKKLEEQMVEWENALMKTT